MVDGFSAPAEGGSAAGSDEGPEALIRIMIMMCGGCIHQSEDTWKHGQPIPSLPMIAACRQAGFTHLSLPLSCGSCCTRVIRTGLDLELVEVPPNDAADSGRLLRSDLQILRGFPQLGKITCLRLCILLQQNREITV